MVVNITTIHFHYQAILGSDVRFNSSDVHYSVFTVYFHGYALHDRVDLSTLSDVAPPFQKTDLSTFLPSKEDISSLNDELTVLISRYVKSYAILDPPFICENEISGIVSRIINSSKY